MQFIKNYINTSTKNKNTKKNKRKIIKLLKRWKINKLVKNTSYMIKINLLSKILLLKRSINHELSIFYPKSERYPILEFNALEFIEFAVSFILFILTVAPSSIPNC